MIYTHVLNRGGLAVRSLLDHEVLKTSESEISPSSGSIAKVLK
jgi:hypothetical protein